MDFIKPILLSVWDSNTKLRPRNRFPLRQKLLNVKVTSNIQLRSASQNKLPKPKPKPSNSIKTPPPPPPPPRTTTNKAKENEKERNPKQSKKKPKEVGVTGPSYELGSLYNYQIRDGETSDWSQDPALPPPNLKLRIL
jgi:hypothetical protein